MSIWPTRIQVSVLVHDPLTFFISMQNSTFHFIFGEFVQNFSDRFVVALFTVQRSPRELPLERTEQIEVCDG
jgi:hypothetical protein